MAGRTTRVDQVNETRDAILAAAERLFAEHGVLAVSNRQISEAAGQGNNAAVNYHFGTKVDLVRAIALKHSKPIERIRVRMLAEVADESDVRAWVACLVRPLTDHLLELGDSAWYARFSAQVMTDPVLRDIIIDAELGGETLQQILDGLNRSLPALDVPVRVERGDMARQLLVHMCAERERALAEGVYTPRATWHATALGLIDAIVALWLAPVTVDQ